MSKRLSKRLQARNLIYNINSSLRKSEKRIKNNFDINVSFDIKTPTELGSLKNMNAYIKNAKAEIRVRSKYRIYKDRTKSTPTSYINKYGVEIPKYIDRKIRRNYNKANRYRKKERMRIGAFPFTVRGKKSGSSVYQRQLIGKDRRYNYYEPLRYNRNSIRNLEGLNIKLEESKMYSLKDFYANHDELLFQNYKDAIRHTFNDMDEANLLLSILSTYSTSDFIHKFYTEDFADISYVYSLEELVAKLKTLLTVWSDGTSFESMINNLGFSDFST